MTQADPPRILLIGGNGYIGRHLAERLAASAGQVTLLGRSAMAPTGGNSGLRYLQGDYADTHVLESLLDSHDVVVHLAYATVPNTSFDDPLADLQQNLPPVVRLFTEIAARGKKLVLVSSGGTVYGEALRLPITEDQPARPISPYGVTKLTLENYAHVYAVTHGLRYVCVRPANAYGPGQRPFIGQGFISTAMASAMRGDPVRIFGERGTVRDYIFIEDLADGIAKLLYQGALSQTYNLGSGEGRSNMDVIDAMEPLLRANGHTLRVEHLPERSFDVRANVLDSTRMRSLTGWAPGVKFESGLEKTYRWLRDNGF
ncbi:NAD-dependent epimerase/dehydratase family protein [Variovorax sp. VNK109]|uniref:NAD-dependent epimerase/dehydratase family protein n=1 Tax=Variovorax sp. VNK109 TaxID=3400919 RepID=UPI003C0ED1C3